MNKYLLLSIFKFMTIAFFVYGHEQDCGAIDSIQMAINSETARISETSFSNYVELAEAHIARGESYLISQQFEKATEDFQKGYELCLQAAISVEKSQLIFRSLFGLVIAYDNLEIFDEALNTCECLKLFIDSLSCPEHEDKIAKHSRYIGSIGFSESLLICGKIQESNIAGPETNEPGWCEEVVEGTAIAMQLLSQTAKSLKVRMSLLSIIEALKVRSLKCCATGEFWKTCVIPIIEKWKEWNYKWNTQRIPPDPLW